MTSQQPPQGGQAKQSSGGESILSKLGGGLSWWIGSLTGKPPVKKPKVQTPTPVPPAPVPPAQTQAPVPVQTQQSANQPNQVAQPVGPQQQSAQVPQPAQTQPPKDTQTGASDSVMQDIQGLKNLVGKFSSNLQKQAGPGVSKGVSTSQQAFTQLAQKAGKSSFLKNILKVFFVILVMMILALLAMRLFKNKPEGGSQPTATPNPSQAANSATPTTFIFNPKNPSVYAEDEEILRLEKDIDVLVREISGTNIKETQLNPPILDYNVSF